MPRLVVLIIAGLLAACSLRPYSFERLRFGMTPDDVSAALGAPLTYMSGRPGDEVFVVAQSANVPSFFTAEERLYLQFRQGQLAGWKGDWNMPWSYF